MHYDNLMLCPEGGAVDFFESGATWRDGSTPVNVSGGPAVQGPSDRGHRASRTSGRSPITFAARPGERQIEGAKVGLAHVIGLGSACGIHILEKAAA